MYVGSTYNCKRITHTPSVDRYGYQTVVNIHISRSLFPASVDLKRLSEQFRGGIVMEKCVFFVVLLSAVIGYVTGHTYHLGACPVVEPMPSFDMSKLLGKWYVIQKTSTASDCITYNFQRGEEPGEYLLEQESQHFLLRLTPLKHDYKYTGLITVEDPAVPAKMRIRFPLSVGGSASYTVFLTDYDTYAAIFTCQKFAFVHRRSATILSRTYDLDKMYVDKIRTRLSSYGVDPFDLSIIGQSGCPKITNDTTINIDIDPETLSAHNIGSIVKSAGEKIGAGIEHTIEAGKSVYHHLTHQKQVDDDQNDREPLIDQRSQRYNKDAEWMP